MYWALLYPHPLNARHADASVQLGLRANTWTGKHTSLTSPSMSLKKKKKKKIL